MQNQNDNKYTTLTNGYTNSVYNTTGNIYGSSYGDKKKDDSSAITLPVIDKSTSSGYSTYANGSSTSTATNSNLNTNQQILKSTFPNTTSGLLYSTQNANVDNTNMSSSYLSSAYKYNESSSVLNQQQGNNYSDQNLSYRPTTFIHDEKLAQEVLARAGPAYTYQRKECSHDIGSLAGDKIDTVLRSDTQGSNNYDYNNHGYQYSGISNSSSRDFSSHHDTTHSNMINQDPNPIRILKPNNQNIVYKQQVNIRYLQPPTPPPPAPIIIREKQLPPPPAQPPIIIRQTAPAPVTPPPLIIREKAPTPPAAVEPTIIERSIPAPDPLPRQVIIERIPAPPTKPRPIVYEKWLPYKPTKRPVIIQKFKPLPSYQAPKNIIIEYEKPKAVAIRHVIEEGIYRADPATYQSSITNGELRLVDRITDLPIENSRILAQVNAERQKYLESSVNISNIEQYLQHSDNFRISMPNLSEKSHYFETDYQTYATSTTYPTSAEYETITTAVPLNVAERIIAEAQASGATISRSTSIVRSGSMPIL